MSDAKILPARDNVAHVKPAAVKKVEKMLTRGRRYFGSSGANFTEQAFRAEWKEREGSRHAIAEEIVNAEREFTKILKKWAHGKDNVVIVDSLYTPKEERLSADSFDFFNGLVSHCFTGHIMFIGNEVFILDSYPFKKKKRYSVDEEGFILQMNKEFDFTNISSMQEKFQFWIDYFEPEALFTGIVGFTGEEATTERFKTWFECSYRLIEEDRYTEFLDQKYGVISEENKKVINPNLIAQAVVRCVKPYDKYEAVFNKTALAGFN